MFNKLDDLIFGLDGRKYQWNWEFWIDLKSFIAPCYDIISKLHLKLFRSIDNKEIDLSKLEIKEFTKISSNFKDMEDF